MSKSKGVTSGPKKLTLTAKDLERAFRGRNFSDKAKDIARRIFVDKHAPAAVATEFQVHIQRVYAVRREVAASYLANTSHPADWTYPQFLASPKLIEKFAAEADAERKRWLRDRG